VAAREQLQESPYRPEATMEKILNQDVCAESAKIDLTTR